MDGPEITGAADNSDQQLAHSLKTFASFGGVGVGHAGGGVEVEVEALPSWSVRCAGRAVYQTPPGAEGLRYRFVGVAVEKTGFIYVYFLQLRIYFFSDHIAAFRVTGY